MSDQLALRFPPKQERLAGTMLDIPSPPPRICKPEILAQGRGRLSAEYVSAHVDPYFQWDRRRILLRWETMVGLPFDFEPGAPLIEETPPGFVEAARQGREIGDAGWCQRAKFEALVQRGYVLDEKFQRLDRRR